MTSHCSSFSGWVYHIWPLLWWGRLLLYQFSIEFFIINGCWILLKIFSESIDVIIWLSTISLLIWYITLIELHIWENPCIPGIKPTWSWCLILLICCWILFSRIFLKIFSSVFISDAAAKLLQSCPTLCDPIDGSPPGSSVPGILQARILEWVAISFSNACMHAC